MKRKCQYNDILESINKIETYTKGIDFDSFCCNEMMFDAVTRNLGRPEISGGLLLWKIILNYPSQARILY